MTPGGNIVSEELMTAPAAAQPVCVLRFGDLQTVDVPPESCLSS